MNLRGILLSEAREFLDNLVFTITLFDKQMNVFFSISSKKDDVGNHLGSTVNIYIEE
jgi:hypothetical protein